MMTQEHLTLAQRLCDQAVCETDEPARAVSVLMTAAASILERHFGPVHAIELMQHGLDNTAAELRRVHAH